MNQFNEDYYERGNELGISGYSNYRWMPELTIPACSRIKEILDIERGETLLDFGCAKGFYVKGFRLLGIEAYGYDISEYAISQADKDVEKYLTSKPYASTDHPIAVTIAGHRYGGYDYIVAKDVLEHVPYDKLSLVLSQLKIALKKKMLIAVPLGVHGKYIVPQYENDITHKIRQPLEWWENQLFLAGFSVLKKEYLIPGLKDNYAQFERGNGFFIVE